MPTLSTVAAYLSFSNKHSLKQREWLQAPVLEVTFDFGNARNSDTRRYIVHKALQEALAKCAPGTVPVILVSIGNFGSDCNKSDILTMTLDFLNENSKVLPEIFLDIRPLGKIGLSQDLLLLSDLMQSGKVKDAKVDSISCKQKPELTYSKFKREGGGLYLTLASSSYPKEKIQAPAASDTPPKIGFSQ